MSLLGHSLVLHIRHFLPSAIEQEVSGTRIWWLATCHDVEVDVVSARLQHLNFNSWQRILQLLDLVLPRDLRQEQLL